MESREDRLKIEARALGFALVGIASAAPADDFASFGAWLDAGHAADMQHLHRYRDVRQHPAGVLPSVRSVVMVGMQIGMGNGEWGMGNQEARKPLDLEATTDRTPSLSSIPHSPFPIPHSRPLSRFHVATFAQAPDYHDLIRARLNRLGAWLAEEVPGCVSRGVTDSAPLLERGFARRAGLGWVGKNCMLINPRHGSFLMLGALLTDVELQADGPFEKQHCGTCTACLDACPTEAFVAPGVLDARRCVSYLTIERRGPIDEELRPGLGGWLFGCDVCQDVCPWNRKAQHDPDTPLRPRPDLMALDPRELLSLSEAEFRQRFRGTALWRAKRSGLVRNAAIVLGNVGTREDLSALRNALADADEMVREAAAWAIAAIEGASR